MGKKLLTINVYFSPQSFGGGTIIAEQMAFRLQAEHGWQVSAMSSMRAEMMPYYAVRRYKTAAVDVFAVNIPGGVAYRESYCNPNVSDVIERLLDSVCPDVVHVHSIQTLGCDFFELLEARGIPFAVTLHDCWWLCERQFMIDGRGQYCFQTVIDTARCHYCVDDYKASDARYEYLRGQIEKADMLLFPSEYHKDLHLANGVGRKKVHINKNGVTLPGPSYRKRPKDDDRTVFGFVGGPGPVKGATLMLQAFNELSRSDYELRVVDAGRLVGISWQERSYWKVPGKLEIVAPYTQDTIDDFFGGIDVLLFPSQWKESFGLTVREALVRDVWVIATDSGGIVEDLRHGENATLIPLDGDYQKLKSAIEECIDKGGWDTYVNPYRTEIRGYSEQAAELSGFLESITIE